MDWVSFRGLSLSTKAFSKFAVHFPGLNRNSKNANKRIPQNTQSPVQQQNQNWRVKKNNGNNGDNLSQNKDWSALFNGNAKDRRNNRDIETATKSNHQPPKTTASRNKFDEAPKREANSRYGFKQPISNPLKTIAGTSNGNWRKADMNMTVIPSPEQFMELSLLEKQTKANVAAASTANAIQTNNDPSIISQSSSGNGAKEEAGDCSDVLRKLLKISSQTAPSPNKESQPFDFLLNKSMPASSTGAPFPNQIPAKMLPKPPSDWTGKEHKPKVQMLSNQHGFPMHPPMPVPMPFMNNTPNGFAFGQAPFIPPPFNPHFNVPTNHPNAFNAPPNHPAMMRPFMHMGPQIAANFNAFPNQMGPQPSTPMHHIKQGPIGPQTLSNNSKHLPGHGAFIPLQAIRKNAKPTKGITGAPSKANPTKSNKQVPLTEQEIHEQIDQFKHQIRSENAKDDERKQQQSQQQPPHQPSLPQKKSVNKGPAKPKADNGNGGMPRPKRLACKFDLPPP